jgi:hypothetical protein
MTGLLAVLLLQSPSTALAQDDDYINPDRQALPMAAKS